MAKDNPVIYGMEEAVSWQNDSRQQQQQPPAGFNDATATLLATLNHSSTLGDVHEAIVDEFISGLAFALDRNRESSKSAGLFFSQQSRTYDTQLHILQKAF